MNARTEALRIAAELRAHANQVDHNDEEEELLDLAAVLEHLAPAFRPDEEQHGHTFRISAVSRGSYGVPHPDGTTDYVDADWFGDEPHVLEVRAFDLPTALRLAAAVALRDWQQPGGET